MNDSDFKKKLTPEQYRVLREKGTEAPFTGKYWKPGAKGMFRCKACGNEIFAAEKQFETNLPGLQGWPSFNQAIPGSTRLVPDDSYGMHRTEVLCNRCGSHLGHLFDDKSETTTGKHYCINSVCLDLEKKEGIVDVVKEKLEDVELPEEEEQENDDQSPPKKSGPSAKNILTMIAAVAVGAGIGSASGAMLCENTDVSDAMLNIPNVIMTTKTSPPPVSIPTPSPTPPPTPPRSTGGAAAPAPAPANAASADGTGI